jgi:hypothetical protein
LHQGTPLRFIRIAVLVVACTGAAQARAQQLPAGESLTASASATAVVFPDAGAPAATSPSAGPQTVAEFSSSSSTLVLDDANVSEAASGQVRTVTQEKPAEKMEQELIIEGLVSYGNYKIFASGYDDKLFTAGVEYDRHSWGYFLGAQADYVAEFLPFALLDKPASVDIFGIPDPKNQKNIRQYVPGIGISPIGFRLQWRSKKSIKPYLEAKGGLLIFAKKVPANEATYVNFSLQSAMGVQVKMTDRWGLRLGLFSDFHFSNAFIVPVNPGLDVMNANLGFSYHF